MKKIAINPTALLLLSQVEGAAQRRRSLTPNLTQRTVKMKPPRRTAGEGRRLLPRKLLPREEKRKHHVNMIVIVKNLNSTLILKMTTTTIWIVTNLNSTLILKMTMATKMMMRRPSSGIPRKMIVTMVWLPRESDLNPKIVIPRQRNVPRVLFLSQEADCVVAPRDVPIK